MDSLSLFCSGSLKCCKIQEAFKKVTEYMPGLGNSSSRHNLHPKYHLQERNQGGGGAKCKTRISSWGEGQTIGRIAIMFFSNYRNVVL